jgi:hypothetical protein
VPDNHLADLGSHAPKSITERLRPRLHVRVHGNAPRRCR